MQPIAANRLCQLYQEECPNIFAKSNQTGTMHVTALMNNERKINAHYTSKNLTNDTIFPESAEQPNLDIVNQQEVWRTGILLNQYFMRFRNNFLNNYHSQPGKMMNINKCVN